MAQASTLQDGNVKPVTVGRGPVLLHSPPRARLR
jgi:hypothetical protein